MPRIKKAHYIWGLFDKRSQIELKTLHTAINNCLDGPKFIQHITLSGPILEDNLYYKKATHLLDYFDSQLSSFPLKVIGLVLGNTEFMSIYISLKKEKKILEVKKIIEKKLGIPFKNFDPHISLYYGIKSFEMKKNISDKIDTSDLSINFSQIAYVEVDENSNSWNIKASRSII